jgi:hypothetical protein
MHIDAPQQTPLLQAASPVHATRHTDAPGDLQVMGASQAEGPSQRTSHVDAVHTSPPPHALGARHSTPQRVPAHLTLPPQLEGLVQRIVHSLAAVQSMPPGHAAGLAHSTRHGRPSGHTMAPVQRLLLAQSKTQTEPMHCPPRIVHRSSQTGGTLASMIVAPPAPALPLASPVRAPAAPSSALPPALPPVEVPPAPPVPPALASGCAAAPP